MDVLVGFSTFPEYDHAAWAVAQGIPGSGPFAERLSAVVAETAPLLAEDAPSATVDVNEIAVALSQAFENLAATSVECYVATDVARPAYDHDLKPHYFLFKLLLERYFAASLGTTDVLAVIAAYLMSHPKALHARLAAADVRLEAGEHDAAIALIKAIASENVLLFLPQELLVKACREKLKVDPAAHFDGVFVGDLTDRFCPVPFDDLMTDNEGLAWTCCPSFMPVPIGFIFTTPWEELWNSEIAKELRRSIIDGDFRYCSRTQCPKIVGNTLPLKSNVTVPKHVNVISPKGEAGLAGPTMFALCHDATCNLACLQCRPGMYRADSVRAKQLSGLLETLVKPILEYAQNNACNLVVSGNGDPFASDHYMEILELLDPERHQGVSLRIITNGLLFKQAWLKLPNIHHFIEHGEMSVSVDAASPEVYADIRGGSWGRLLENLVFLGELRRQNKVKTVGINYAVQERNYKDMKHIVMLANALGFDTVGFNQVRNHGTYTAEDYQNRAIFEPTHPRYGEFLEELRHPAFRTQIADLGSLAPHYRRANSLDG